MHFYTGLRVYELLYTALLAMSFCHCKNVDRTEVKPAGEVSRAFQRDATAAR